MTSTLIWVAALSVLGAQAPPPDRDNRGGLFTADFGVGGTLPQADLADRFGSMGTFGVGVDYLTAGNWILGGDFLFLYGARVNENPLAALFDDRGQLFGDNLEPAFLAYRARGQYYGGRLGRLFPLGQSDNVRSGIRVVLGAGFLQHKIRIQEDPTSPTPQFVGAYASGYDRLTNGLALQQQVGYQYLSANRRVNFYVGLDLYQGFTRGRRNFDFDTGLLGTADRLDVLTGLRAAWILPFYTGTQANEIYY